MGTGPASAICSLSDIYRSINLFGKENHISTFAELKFDSDYVENSGRFRDWLHHFTEFANVRNRGDSHQNQWIFPFHHGSFIDAYNSDPRTQRWLKETETSFDIVTIGNFITEENQVRKLERVFVGLSKVLKSGGMLLVTGGGSNWEYFEKVAEFFQQKWT